MSAKKNQSDEKQSEVQPTPEAREEVIENADEKTIREYLENNRPAIAVEVPESEKPKVPDVVPGDSNPPLAEDGPEEIK